RHTRSLRDWSSDVCSSDLLRPQDRAQLSQIKSLYVYSSRQDTRVPLLSVATVKYILETGRIRRRTISILCFPAPGVLASEVLGRSEERRVGKGGRSRWAPN